MTVCALPEKVAVPTRRAGRARAAWGFLIGLCVLSALVARLSFLVRPLDADGAMFIYMGKLVSQGGRIGAELIDNKFPMVGLMTSACWRAFGACWPAYVLLQTAMGFAGAFLLARSARRNIGIHAAWPTGLFALVYLNFNFAVYGGFQLETLQAFFSILAATAGLEALGGDDARDSFLAGLSAGAAAMLKPSGLAVLGALGVALVLRRRRLATHAAAAAAGLAIPAAATLAYLRAADLLGSMPAIWRQIAGYAANSPWEPWDLSKPVIVILILGFPLLIRGVVFRRVRHRMASRPNRSILIFAIVWMALEAAGVAAQRRMYAYHFLVLAAPASLLFGLIPRKDRALPLLAALALPMLLSAVGAGMVVVDGHNPLGRLPASQYLAAHATEGDAVWEDGMMRLLIETNLRPGSRYPMTFLWVNGDDTPLEYCRVILRDFDERQPKYILLPTQIDWYIQALSNHIKELGLHPKRKQNYVKAWINLRDYVQSHYRPEAQVGKETVYRRRN
ncbi:MAG: glycosyltransferase family 39 protein [Tepidisphaeraceae bacterium]